MITEFKKYDKQSLRTVYIKTEIFNKMLANANASIKVIPRDVELQEYYEAYLKDCKILNKPPLSKANYEKEYFFISCSFKTYEENVPSEILLEKALDVHSIRVEYAKDSYGKNIDDELKITYRIK